MSGQRQPVLRVALPRSELEIVDKKYLIKEVVDRQGPGRAQNRKLVLDFEIYRRLIDNVRTVIEDKVGAEVSADPAMIVEMMSPLLLNEELLTEHVYEEANSAPTEAAEWALIREVFAWRLVGRYNRELLQKTGEEGDNDDDEA